MRYIMSLFRSPKFLFLSIFIIGFLARFYRLGSLPFGFHEDEVVTGYVGRLILTHGKDLYGNHWPLLYFDQFGDYPPVLSMYLSGLATFIFGVSEFAVRFPAAILGSLSVLLVGYLGSKTFKSLRVGLISSLFLAILPWHIVLSRSSAEGVIALSSFLLGLSLLFKAQSDRRIFYWLAGFAFIFLTYLLYQSYRVFVPLALLPLPLIFNNHKRINWKLVVPFVLACLLTLYIATTTWGRGRFSQTSVFTAANSPVEWQKNSYIFDEGESGLLAARILHNKIVLGGRQVIEQSLGYFSTTFLFTPTGLPFRYSVPDEGVLYLIFIPLWGLALICFNRWDKLKPIGYFAFLILAASLPAALTIDDVPNIHRSLFMSVPFVLFAAFGLSRLSIWKAKKKYFVAVCLVIVLSLAAEQVYFLHQYFQHMTSFRPTYRGVGNRELITDLISREKDYGRVVATDFNWMPIYYLFYSKNFSSDYIGQFRQGLKIDNTGKIQWVSNICATEGTGVRRSVRTLVVELAGCPDKDGFKLITTVNRPNGTAAFRILEDVRPQTN